MNTNKTELDCYARLLKSAIETGGWVIGQCNSCPHKFACRDDKTGGYKLEYLIREKLTNITGINLIDVIPFASEKYSIQ